MPRKPILAAWLKELGEGVAEEPELRQLLRRLEGGPGARPRRGWSLARAAEMAHRAGARVRWGEYGGGEEDRMLSLESPEALAAGMQRLHAALKAAQSSSDREAVERARKAARRYRRRALQMAGNGRLQPEIRAQKRELADWLLIWLEMPDAFFDWLELRRRQP